MDGPFWRPEWVGQDQRTHKQFIEHTADLFAVDRRHIHVSGFSLGSYATWKMLAESSELVCSIAAAEFPPFALNNPTGDGCTAGIGPIWTWDGPPTCFATSAHCGADGRDFHKRSILWAFGHQDTVCNGDLNLMGRQEDGDAVMEETVQQVGQVYKGRHLTDRDITNRHVNDVSWQWREYDLGDGLKLETLAFPGGGAVPFPGHCLVRRDPRGAQAVCPEPGDYNWGEEAVRFFREQPCDPASAVSYVNVAQGKPATQSSTQYDGEPSRAVDGNSNSAWGGGSCTHTNNGPTEWWQVDLEQSYDIQSVDIWHRNDCCQTRLLTAVVIVSDTTDFSTGTTCGAIDDHLGEPDETSCNHAGRYVTVLHHNEFITICELQVMAVSHAGSPPPTPPRTPPAPAPAACPANYHTCTSCINGSPASAANPWCDIDADCYCDSNYCSGGQRTSGCAMPAGAPTPAPPTPAPSPTPGPPTPATPTPAPPPPPAPSGGCTYDRLIAEDLPNMQAVCCRNNHCRANGRLKQCSDRCAQAIGALKRTCAAALTGSANGRAVDGLLTQSVADGGCQGHGSGQATSDGH
jgi:hypothetical protein